MLADRYQVRAGDTASGIARRLTGQGARWHELRALNPKRNWDLLRVGEVLILPSSWTRPVAIGDAASTGMTLDEARRRTPWLSPNFMPRLRQIAEKYGMNPFELLGVLYQESGVHPSANPNPVSNANGLIHWMPNTAPRGTTHARLVQMSAEEQLELVDDWMSTWARKLGGRPFSTPGLVYATVFSPGRITPESDERTVSFSRVLHGRAYSDNSGLDVDKDGVITFGDLSETIRRRMREASFEKFRVRMLHEGGATPSSPLLRTSKAGYAVVACLVTLGVVGVGAAVAAHVWR